MAEPPSASAGGGPPTPQGAGPVDDDPARGALEHALWRVVWELRPYLADVVVIGGWVPYLYQRYGPFPTWRGRLALTAEVDVLVTRELPAGDRAPLAAILETAGFVPTRATHVAAVWAGDPARGEKIEFLVPHDGPYRYLGKVVPVRAQRGVGAISLTALDVLQRHTNTLTIPAVAADGTRTLLDVRVPLLGAYVINKAATFERRIPRAGEWANPKRAKDLLYLRDLMHGGPDVVDVLEHDIAEILARDPAARHLVDAAANSLHGATHPGATERLGEVAAMLVEREPELTRAEAHADVAGHLADLGGILVAFRSPDPPSIAHGEDEGDDVED